MAKVGRNDPCPCGSGRKFKFCCLSKSVEPLLDSVVRTDDSFSVSDVGADYQTCDLTQEEIDANCLHEMSAPRMLYSLLLTPGVEAAASMLTNKVLTRAREQAKRIQAAASIDELIEIMRSVLDSLNHDLLVSRLLEFGHQAAERMLDEFSAPVDASMLELGIRVVFRSGLHFHDRVKALIETGPRRAYMVSLLCMLLGFDPEANDADLLWAYYCFLKARFPTETYSDGPLLALIEMRLRADKARKRQETCS